MASMSRASWAVDRRWVPLKSMCSIKWAAPFSRGASWREPTPTKKPNAAERAPGTSSVSSRAPLGRVIC